MTELPTTPQATASVTPEITVVIVVLKGGDALGRCLAALSEQEGVSRMEIIVVYDDTAGDVTAYQRAFSNAQWLPFSGRRTYAELRTAGVSRSRGTVVAITEDHCVPAADWAAQIVKAHQGDHGAVGGPVDKLTPDTALNWALYLADYVRYANPIPEGPIHHLTDCNVSYRRAVLESIADVWQDEFHEPEVHAALHEQGKALWFAPRVLVRQQRSMTFREAVRDRYAFGRLFGGRRVQQLPLSKRLVYAASALVLPVLLMVRVAGHVFGKRRYIGALIRAFPLVLLLNSLWALGEFTGYATGRVGALAPGQTDDARKRNAEASA